MSKQFLQWVHRCAALYCQRPDWARYWQLCKGGKVLSLKQRMQKKIKYGFGHTNTTSEVNIKNIWYIYSGTLTDKFYSFCGFVGMSKHLYLKSKFLFFIKMLFISFEALDFIALFNFTDLDLYIRNKHHKRTCIVSPLKVNVPFLNPYSFLFPHYLITPSIEAVHNMLSVIGTMQSTDSASRANRSLVAPNPFQLKM